VTEPEGGWPGGQWAASRLQHDNGGDRIVVPWWVALLAGLGGLVLGGAGGIVAASLAVAASRRDDGTR
jgi:hypothetical protein